MILIVGGACQGKAEFARSLMVKEKRDGDGRQETPESDSPWDGMKDPWRQAVGKRCLINFHGFLRRAMEDGMDPDAFTEEALRGGTEIFTMDEVGNGIVPLEKTEREYREAVGRAGQRIAAESDQVYRVICGIPVQIKTDMEPDRTDDGI